MASRLEAATKQYGVPLLLSGPLHLLLSEKVKTICREIDCVTVKGSKQPIKLFTVDVDTDNMKECKDRCEGLSTKDKKQERKFEREHILKKLSAKGTNKTVFDFMLKDEDFRELR